MRDTVKLGRIGGIPIGVNWSIIAVAVYLAATLTLAALPRWFPSADLTSRVIASVFTTLLFFLSILVHELGHAIVAKRHGIEVDGITLWLLGGIARLRQQASTPAAEFQVAAAGPAGSFAMALVFAGAAIGLDRLSSWQLAAGASGWLAIVNLLLALSNLIPAAPLDGGRVLTSILWWRNGDAERSRILSARCGLVLGAVLVAGFTTAFFVLDELAAWLVVFGVGTGLFLAHAAVGEISGAVIRGRLQSTTTQAVMTTHPPSVPDSLTVGQFLNWAGTEGGHTACPVVRWDFEPIGYVAPSALGSVPTPDRSWTTLSQVMTPAPNVARAWSTESVAEVLERLGDDKHSVIVLHNPDDSSPVGTLTRPQLDQLFASPTLWGIDKKMPAPPQSPDLSTV